MRVVTFMACVWATLTVLHCPAGADESTSARILAPEQAEAELERLKQLWKIRSSEIQTYDIQYRMYHTLPVTPPLTPEQFETRLQEFGLYESPTRLNEFLTAISPGFQPLKELRRLIRDGQKARYQNGNNIKIQDGELQFDYNVFNKTIAVRFTHGNMVPIPPLDWLREIPPPIKVKASEASMALNGSVVKMEYDTEIITMDKRLSARREFTFDAMSGIPIRRHYHIEAKPVESLYQLSLVVGPDGVVFPSCAFRLMYDTDQNRVIDRVTATELVDALFNSSIPPEMFSLPKPRGVAVFDSRKGERMLDLTGVEAEDVRFLINEPVIYEYQPRPIPWQRRAFFIVNGLVLIGIGVWLWRRVSLKEPKH